MAKMLYSQVINVTSFAWLHLGEQDVVELRDGHWSNFGLFLSKLEDVEVIKLAEIIKTTVKTFGVLIQFAKMFSVRSKALQNIFTMKGPDRCVECRGGGVRVSTPHLLHVRIDLVPVLSVGVH